MKRGARLAVGGLAAGGAIACWALVLHVSADVIYLNDGSEVEGEIVRRTDSGWSVKATDGKITTVDASKVRSLEAKRAGAGNGSNGPLPSATTKPAAAVPAADTSMQGLISLRHSVENQTDINRVLERY